MNKNNNWYKTEYQKEAINSNSWFDINVIENKNYSAISKQLKKEEKEKYLSTKKIFLYPNLEQKQIILKWMDLFIDMYNISNNFINNNVYDFTNDRIITENKRRYLNFRNLRDNYIKVQKKSLYRNKINKHLLDEAIKHNVAKHKTCCTNFFQKNINFFRIRKMKKRRRKKILIIESALFSKTKNSFCSSILGNMESSEPLNTIKKTSTLQYDKHLNRFTLYIPEEKECIKFSNNNDKCGIDPGVRTFLTCYSNKKIIEIGNNCYKKYKPIYKKIDKIRTLYSKKCISKKKFTKALNHYHDKIKNLTKDLHYKSARFLCQNFDNISIGKISTRNIVSKKKNKLNKISKRAMLSLSHYKFREEVLKHYCNKSNNIMNEIDESYTSKTCHSCFNINKKKNETKVFKCEKCNLICDRDINASINIYYK